MRMSYVLFALVLAASAATPTALGAQQEATVSVTLLDQDGERVSGVTLTASWSGGDATATTDANGRATIEAPDGASVAIDVEDDTYLQNVPTVVTANERSEVTVHVAERGAATVRVDSAAGESLSGARVVLSRNNSTIVSGTTDASGEFTAEPIEQGNYRLTVVKAGFVTDVRSLSVDASSVRQSVTLEPGTVSVRFRVVDDRFDDPRPLDGATVAVESVGRFESTDGRTGPIEVPVNAELDIDVSKTGYETVSRTVTVGESNVTTTIAVQRTSTLRVDVAATAVAVNESVAVSVTDEYEAPVRGATLVLRGEAVGTTDGDGRASVPVTSAGTHNLTALKGDVSSEPVVVKGIASAETTSTQTATARPAPTATATTSTESAGSGPGFGGPLTLLVAVTTVALLSRRR